MRGVGRVVLGLALLLPACSGKGTPQTSPSGVASGTLGAFPMNHCLSEITVPDLEQAGVTSGVQHWCSGAKRAYNDGDDSAKQAILQMITDISLHRSP